jgi:phage terminase small subunit
MARTNENRERKRFSKPRPPAHLTDAEAAIWTRTCKDQTGEWCEVAAAGIVLEMYCVAVAQWRLTSERRRAVAEQLADEVILAEAKETARLMAQEDALTEAAAKQGAHIIRLESTLRLTPQSRIRNESARNDPPAPWDMHPTDDGDTA